MTFVSKTRAQSKATEEELFEALFRSTGVDGIYGRSGEYEGVVEALGGLISKHRDPRAEVVRFPPVVSRNLIEKLGYLKSFPNLLGCVCGLSGGEREIGAAVDRFMAGGDWTETLSASDLVLAPAACYAVYPLAAARSIPAEGALFDVACDCFRREPSRDIDRLQSFRMREFVLIARAEQAQAFREQWMERAQGFVDKLELSCRVAPANDPFFGRGGVLLGRAQAEQQLKFELLVPVRSAEKPTACMSFNYHRDHFGQTLNMRDGAGVVAHSSCVAFGMDRLAVALFATHGARVAEWPNAVRDALGLRREDPVSRL
jgi:seryl-tRNA synthetase